MSSMHIDTVQLNSQNCFAILNCWLMVLPLFPISSLWGNNFRLNVSASCFDHIAGLFHFLKFTSSGIYLDASVRKKRGGRRFGGSFWNRIFTRTVCWRWFADRRLPCVRIKQSRVQSSWQSQFHATFLLLVPNRISFQPLFRPASSRLHGLRPRLLLEPRKPE